MLAHTPRPSTPRFTARTRKHWRHTARATFVYVRFCFRAAGAHVLFRGLRLKVGIDVGHVHASINPMTGRITYRCAKERCTRRGAERSTACTPASS